MPDPVIVIAAYNRAQPLDRLLKSVGNADYPHRVGLFISLEGGASEDVETVVQEFSSPKFEVEVIRRPEKLGLRKHILACGDLALKFGAVIVLEDDLVVDRYFYRYATAALEHYAADTSVSGIALYADAYNGNARLPFEPMANGYSTYPAQLPCSWGQCWTAQQWQHFRTWYEASDSKVIVETIGIPEPVKMWSENSWKKYFAAYMVQTNRHFIYPYQAYSTNCSDPGGTHIVSGSTLLQVNFATPSRPEPAFSFCPTNDPEVAYDAFMEPAGASVFRQLGLRKEEIEIDTLGIKPMELLRRKPYSLTCRSAKNAIRHYPRAFRPLEHNFQYPSEINDRGAFSLAKSSDVYSFHTRTLAEYSYFARLDIMSARIALQIIKALPKTIWGYIARRWRK